MELYKIFKNNLLNEGRKEDVMAKFPDIDKNVIERLSQNDPSGNNKYLEWMANAVASNFSIPNIIEEVTKFHEQLNKINTQNISDFIADMDDDLSQGERNLIVKSPKDINSYNFRTLRSLNLFISKLTSKKDFTAKMRKESDRIYEDDNLLVLSPRTHEASCHYGVHSSWCVATSNVHHFNNYTKKGVLYFFISKNNTPPNQYWADKDSGQPPYKTALLLEDNGDISWWSKGDANYSNGWVGDPKLPMLTEDIASKVLAHNKYIIENRRKREIETILETVGFYTESGNSDFKNNFKAFVRSNIFTPEQLVSIIRNDNWLALYESSDTGEKLRSILGSNVVFSLFREMIIQSSNLSNTLKKVHTQDFLSVYSETLSDEQNKELANLIIEKLGGKPKGMDIGSDNKMFVDKWTMSPKDWEKYETTSNYFFIGNKVDGDLDIIMYENQSMVKVDRFVPKDHHKVHMLKLGAKHLRAKLYGVVTEKNLLDDYLDKPMTRIPEPIVKLIANKAQEINR